MIGKTHEFKGRIYVEIPPEIVKLFDLKPGDEIEFKNVYKELVIVVPKKMGEREKNILKKVARIRYSDRTWERLKEILSQEERRLFDDMMNRGVFFEYKKGGKTLIGIDRNYMPIVSDPLMDLLDKQGYLIAEEGEIEKVNKLMKEFGKDKECKGIIGFDKKLYVVKNELIKKYEKTLLDMLKQEKSFEQLTKVLEADPLLIKAILEILREEGKIIEKRKNVYEVV